MIKVKKILMAASGICFIAFCSGCAQDQYAVEKQFYQALKQAEKIFANPHATPPNELARVVKLLKGFSEKYPRSKLAADAGFNVARLYIVKEEYENARAQLKELKNTYDTFMPICAEAVYLTGTTYELQDKWDSALAQYKKIMREYPLTPRGMTIPFYIIQHYKVKFMPDKMKEAARYAISHYDALADKYPDSPLALRCRLSAAECYVALDEPQSAINSYQKIIEQYKAKATMDTVLINMAMIYSRQLKDNVKAKETLETMIQDYPKSKLVATARNIIKNLKE
jgi:TolA-binding protein